MPGFNREIAKAQAAGAAEGQPQKRKLFLICSKGSLDMAYPPLILANAARANGVECSMFFTFWGLDIITKAKINGLHVATVGNPNMHPWFHIPTMVGGLPGMSAMASAMMRQEIAKLGIPPVGEFLQMCKDAGVKLYGCLATVDMMRLKREDLVDYLDDVIDANQFIEMSEGAQIIFI